MLLESSKNLDTANQKFLTPKEKQKHNEGPINV